MNLRNLTAIAISVLVAAIMVQADGRQRRSTRNVKHRPVAVEAAAAPSVATLAADSLVRFSGYDKTINATRETVFVTNHAEGELVRLLFTIDYYDADKKCINSRTLWQNVSIPPGQTRCLDIPSWDRQRSFYYLHSKRPRSGGIPYTVAIRPDSAVIMIQQ